MSAKLPYKIPGTEKGKIEFLCNLLGTSYSKYSKYPNHIVIEALTGIVVYHQLGHIERMNVMEFLHKNLDGPALSAAIGKITDPMVNPHWGLWSLSTDQLKEDLEFAEAVSTYIGLAGGGFSVSGAKDLWVKSRTDFKSKFPKGHPVLVIAVWGFYFNNEGAKKAIQKELLRRTMSH